MRLVAMLALAALLAACSSSSSPPDLSTARTKTTAAGTAKFTLTVTATVAGTNVRADENGTLSFARRRARIYKLVPGGGLPQEVVVDGPYTYTNGNVQAALADSTVKPWTKLDTRRLTAKQRLARPDELAHVRAAAYLSDGVTEPKRIGDDHGATHYRGRVDPARVVARAPVALRRSIGNAIRSDYLDTPFGADFWVDDTGRVTRVTVGYTTPRGGKISIDAAFSDFGAPVDLTLPPAEEIEDISPR